MKIESNSWHAKLYRIWHRRKFGRDVDRGEGINLCPYVRIVLFWWWFGFIFGNGRIGRVYIAWFSWGSILASIEYLFWIMGIPQVLYGTLIVGECVLATLALFALIFYVTEKTTLPRRVGNGMSTFTELIASRAENVHHQICPIIRIQ